MKVLKFIGIILIVAGIAGCNKAKLEDVKQLTEQKVFPVEKARNITYVFSDSSIIKARLETPYMEKFLTEDPYIEMPEGLKVRFFDHLQQPNSYLKANYGIQYLDRKIIEVMGNVVVVNSKGDTLTTEHLIWDEKNDKVHSEKFVRVRTEDEIIKSEGFESDPGFNKYKFKNITGIINLVENEEETGVK